MSLPQISKFKNHFNTCERTYNAFVFQIKNGICVDGHKQNKKGTTESC